MGNIHKKENTTNKENNSADNKPILKDKEINEFNKSQIKIPKYEPKKINLKLIKKLDKISNDIIEEAISYPDENNTIILACRSGNIIKVSDLISSSKKSSSIKVLFNFSKRLFSLILLNKNNKNLCVGLNNEIAILKFNLGKKNKDNLEDETYLSCEGENGINSLLELQNGNIISAGKNIILWKFTSSKQYTKVNSIPIGFNRIINIIEFPNINTILATQEETHIIFLLKNEENSINLIKQKENIPSIWYKGSAQNLSKDAMILVGKFELNVIEPNNGDIISRYPGIDRGTLLNLSQNYKEKDFWIVSHFMGRYFEFYQQEGNDLLYFEKYEFEDNEEIGWGNRLVKINNEYFASINHYGDVFIFQIKIIK